MQISLHGRCHQLRLPVGQRLRPRCRCRAGRCGTCRCKVAQGKVVMHNNLVLLQQEVDDGWVLACQAEADAPWLDICFDHGAKPVSPSCAH
nr:2Fe-2S iron-sulfur cluster-binding protein [Aquitalea magnusonii]